jgi:hypothetical protein
MPDPLLRLPRNGTAGQPVEPLPDGPADAADVTDAADDRPGTEETTPPLMNLGSADAAVCTDGVCVL